METMSFIYAVIEFDSSEGMFNVEYEDNSDGEKYSEDFNTSTWKIWAGSEEEYAIERDNKVSPCFCIQKA